MDVKRAFLNVIIEEVYVKQPLGFILSSKTIFFKLKKALYGLKQVPRAWYHTLSNFLLENDFKKGKFDTTIFKRKSGTDFIVVQIYVDDIILVLLMNLYTRTFQN
uniref:Retrovirus-related Pol polyprotein from transposon TNT 1-94 n=1 Tax=Cajanus cajan TaxID=3821 RepID=A0A151RFG1_CAJCA|nr:Retrovirus-related Pol polyprotein from transposon TNT 1-94 [Cajanus cajan]